MSKLNLLAYPLVAIFSLAAAGAAFADDPTVDHSPAFASSKTRAQVQSELFQARADGSIKVSSTTYNPLLVAKSEKSRAEVQGEVLAERNSAAYYGEDSGSFELARVRPARVVNPIYAGTPKSAQ